MTLPEFAGGTVLGGIVGLFFRVLVGRQAWLAMGLSVATSVAAMEATSLQYPPGLLESSYVDHVLVLANEQ